MEPVYSYYPVQQYNFLSKLARDQSERTSYCSHLARASKGIETIVTEANSHLGFWREGVGVVVRRLRRLWHGWIY